VAGCIAQRVKVLPNGRDDDVVENKGTIEIEDDGAHGLKAGGERAEGVSMHGE
jgi:hypothetical protein